MKIDESTLQQIEQLAKLTVSDEDRELSLKKMVGVLDMLDRINMADIADLPPLYHPLEISQAMREDTANADIDREHLQSGAPQTQNGLFLVPKVIE